VDANLSASNLPSDSVRLSESKWFFGPFGFVIHNAKPLPFRPLPGKLRFLRCRIDFVPLFYGKMRIVRISQTSGCDNDLPDLKMRQNL
jgi:hypothetical protein